MGSLEYGGETGGSGEHASVKEAVELVAAERGCEWHGGVEPPQRRGAQQSSAGPPQRRGGQH
eukprot:216225-Lingulodinium_polyedra.AAC.1